MSDGQIQKHDIWIQKAYKNLKLSSKKNLLSDSVIKQVKLLVFMIIQRKIMF